MTGEHKLDELIDRDDLHPDGGEATITEVLEGYARGGFASSFVVTEQATLECVECGAESLPGSSAMSSLRRLEGMSDPADMVAVVALTCPVCAARGTTILGFGPNATEQDAGVLSGLRDRRDAADVPGNSAPGETTGDA
jgi:hypothetical protein